MELFWKAAAGILITALLSLTLGKDMGFLLCLVVCAMGSMITLEYLEPVIDLLQRLEAMADLQSGMLGILLKAMGITMISELASVVCDDSGNSSLGKSVRILAKAAILWLSVPLFQAVLTILQQILGEL